MTCYHSLAHSHRNSSTMPIVGTEIPRIDLPKSMCLASPVNGTTLGVGELGVVTAPEDALVCVADAAAAEARLVMMAEI